MLKRAASKATLHPWRMLASRPLSTLKSMEVNTIIETLANQHYCEVADTMRTPEVSPPSPFTIVKGSFGSKGPVLTRTYGNEEINISAIQMTAFIPASEDDKKILKQLFLHVDVSKPGQSKSLQFLCGLHPDAIGIYSISLRAKSNDSGFVMARTKYNGPSFLDLDDKLRDAIHNYIKERGITESLFPFLQAWLYVKDKRKLMDWFRLVSTFTEKKEA